MLSGKRAFHGESAVETMNAILKEDPPELSQTSQHIAPGLARVVDHCLEKNPEERFQSARDLAFALEALSGSSATSAQTVTMPAFAPQWFKRRELIAWAVAGIAILGAGKEVLLLKTDLTKNPTDWSADGRYILYTVNDPKTKFELWVLPLFGDQKPFPFLQTEFNERFGRFSPDGRWIAYASDESGDWQVYVQNFPAGGGKWQVSTNGGSFPAWRRDGKELYYVSPDKKVMAVDVKGAGGTFERGVPKALFDLKVSSFVSIQARFAVTADGQRFLVNNTIGENASSPIAVVLNWTADLKR